MAFDEVRRERERRAGESDERDLWRQIAAERPDRLEQIGRGPLGRHDAQRGDVRCRAYRALDDRTEVGLDVKGHAHPVEWQHDVGVQDRGVDAKPVDRHPRYARAQLGLARDLQDAVLLAQRAGFREATSRLPHVPDRRALDALASERPDEEGRGHDTASRTVAPSIASSARSSGIAAPTKIGVSRSVYAEDSVSRRSATSERKRRTSGTSKETTNSWSSMPKLYPVWIRMSGYLWPTEKCAPMMRVRSWEDNAYHERFFVIGYTTT